MTTTYKTTRTTRVTRTDAPAPSNNQHMGGFTLTMPRPGVIEFSGLDPAKLAERLPHVVRLLTR